jgi:hypothetical protein
MMIFLLLVTGSAFSVGLAIGAGSALSYEGGYNQGRHDTLSGKNAYASSPAPAPDLTSESGTLRDIAGFWVVSESTHGVVDNVIFPRRTWIDYARTDDGLRLHWLSGILGQAYIVGPGLSVEFRHDASLVQASEH